MHKWLLSPSGGAENGCGIYLLDTTAGRIVAGQDPANNIGTNDVSGLDSITFTSGVSGHAYEWVFWDGGCDYNYGGNGAPSANPCEGGQIGGSYSQSSSTSGNYFYYT